MVLDVGTLIGSAAGLVGEGPTGPESIFGGSPNGGQVPGLMAPHWPEPYITHKAHAAASAFAVYVNPGYWPLQLAPGGKEFYLAPVGMPEAEIRAWAETGGPIPAAVANRYLTEPNKWRDEEGRIIVEPGALMEIAPEGIGLGALVALGLAVAVAWAIYRRRG